MTGRRRVLQIGLLAVMMGLALPGCSWLFSPSPTRISVSVSADEQINPDSKSQPAPLVLMFYELKSHGTFDQANFADLFYQPAATLGGDLLGQSQIEITPGEKTQFNQQVSDQTRYVGVVAGYRDIANANWRAVVPAPAHDTTTIDVSAGRLSLEAKGDDGWF
jgi:type VI secretion system protein VasD